MHGFRPPGVLAQMAAAVDEVSGGRFVLGLGAGWNEAEFRAFGLPFDHRVARFEEAFAIVRAAARRRARHVRAGATAPVEDARAAAARRRAGRR